MHTISIVGEAGLIKFIPARISAARILKIEKELKRIIVAQANTMTAIEMRALLKKRDPRHLPGISILWI